MHPDSLNEEHFASVFDALEFWDGGEFDPLLPERIITIYQKPRSGRSLLLKRNYLTFWRSMPSVETSCHAVRF